MIGRMGSILAPTGEKGLASALIFHRVVGKRDPVLQLDLDAAEFEMQLRCLKSWISQAVGHCCKARLDLGETQGRPPGTALHPRNFRRLPSSTSGSSMRFMGLPWRLTSTPCVSHTFRRSVGLPILAASPLKAALVESIAHWVARSGPRALRRHAARVPLSHALMHIAPRSGLTEELEAADAIHDALHAHPDGLDAGFAVASARQEAAEHGDQSQDLIEGWRFRGRSLFLEGIGCMPFSWAEGVIEAGLRFIERNISHVEQLMHGEIEGFSQDSAALVVGLSDQRRLSAFEVLPRDGDIFFDLAKFPNRSGLRGKIMELRG